MTWFQKLAFTDKERINRNIERLINLKDQVHKLSYFVVSSNSGGYKALRDLIDDSLIRGRPLIQAKLKSALIGENNQKIALDAPTRFQAIMHEGEEMIQREINRERKNLKELEGE